jgi:hypothetical protein
MISTNLLNSEEFMVIDLKRKLSNIYLQSGIPIKYHFETLEKGWSTEFSPSQKLSGVAKERSKLVKKIISAYIDYLDGILNTQGLKLKFKDSYVFLTDMILDGGKESGKTFLLSLIAQAAINKGYKVKYVTWVDYLDRFQSFETRNNNEDFFEECKEADLLIFDSVYDYNISANSKFFIIQLDRLMSNRLDSGKTTICSIDSQNGANPVFGSIWNRFTRETFTLHLPGAIIENRTKRS